MLPIYNEETSGGADPSIGSFGVAPTDTHVQDSLVQILEKRLKQEIPDSASIAEVERITQEKNNARTLLNEMQNRQVVEAKEKTNYPGNPNYVGGKIGGEIKPPTPPAEEIKRDERLKDLMNSQPNTENTRPDFAHIPQSEESLASRGDLLPDFKNREAPKPTIITSEMIREIPSAMPDKRILRMPKISKPRPRIINGRKNIIINGKTNEERMATLIKPEATQHDVIDTVLEIGTVLEKVSDQLPSVDTTIERIQAYDYQRIGDLVGKLQISIGDKRKYIEKIFHDMFSDEPMPTGQKNKI